MPVLESIAWSALLLGVSGASGLLGSRALGYRPNSATGLAAAFVLAWAWITVGMLVLGSTGLIARAWIFGWSVCGLGVAAFAAWYRRLGGVVPELGRGDPVSSSDRLEVSSMIGLVLFVWACLTVGLNSLLLPVKVVSDGPIYHLPFAVRWWKEGRLSLIASPFGESAATYFPANGDVWLCWLTTAWGGDRLARIGQLPFLGLAALAVYGICRRLGARGDASVLATCTFGCLVPLLLWSFEPIVDTISAAGYLACVLFLVEFFLHGRRARELALAGLAAGLTWGTKMTSIVFVVPLLLAAAGAIWVTGDRKPILHTLVLGCGAMATGGYWPARNWALTGNPIYPAHVEFWGRVWLSGWYRMGDMGKSPFAIPRENWKALIDTLVGFVDFRLAPLWLAALLGIWAIRAPARLRAQWVWLFTAAAVVNVLLFWLLIPYRTQQRFIIHAFGLAAVPLAMLLDRSRALRWLAAFLLAVHLLTPSTWPFPSRDGRALWSLTGLVPSSAPPLIRLPLHPTEWAAALGSDMRIVLMILHLLRGVAAAVVVMLILFAIRAPRRGIKLAAFAAALGTIAGLGMAVRIGTDAEAVKFPQFDHTAAWNALDRLSPPGGARVAYAGTNLPYYLMGSDLRNHVEYVNVDSHTDWLMHNYHLAAGANAVWPDPRPGWDRLAPDYGAWRANLARRHIDFLVVARARLEDGEFNIADSERFPIERVWAEAHPGDFEPVYGMDPPDPLIKIYRVRPTPGFGDGI